MNSSPDSLNPSQSSSSSPPTDSSLSQSLIERYSAKHTSKIPIPVLGPKNKSRRTLLNGHSQQRTLKAQIRDSVSHYNGASMNNSKVDQIIADLLIEALNHSTDIGIEFIKTPQNASPQSHIKLNPAKRMSLGSRRANGHAIAGSSGSGGKRSSHSSAKYQQIFDSIPEEKSGSLSYDSSPNDEQSSTSPPIDQASSNNSTRLPTEIETESNTTATATTTTANKSSSSPNKSLDTNSKRASPPKQQSNGIQTKIASGKAAIESDQVKSETWFGCFGRTHVDSPVDGLLMDEGILKIMHNTSLAV